MVITETPYRGTAGRLTVGLAALGVLTLLAMSGPATAQDQAADEAPGAAGEAAVDVSDPVERFFIRSTGDAGMLAQRYPHLAVWLEPDGAPRVLALVEPEAVAPARGAAVILSDEGQSANHALVEVLRRHLTEAGWAALSLGNDELSPSLLLARQRLAVDVREPSEEVGDGDQPVMIDVNDQTAEDLVAVHQSEMDARLAAAVAWSQGRGYESVMLIGIGRGASAVSHYLPHAPEVVTRMVWIMPRFDDQTPDELVAALADSNVPVLELYPSAATDAVQRRAAFQRAERPGFEAVPVPLRGGEVHHHGAAIASRLTGWAAH